MHVMNIYKDVPILELSVLYVEVLEVYFFQTLSRFFVAAREIIIYTQTHYVRNL